jgi:hypothetical protein
MKLRPSWHYEAQQLRIINPRKWTYEALALRFRRKNSSAAYNACLSDEKYAIRKERARKYWFEIARHRRNKCKGAEL